MKKENAAFWNGSGAQRLERIVNFLCAAILLVLLIGQFTPYWHYGDGQTSSINGYVWFPTDSEHKALESYLSEELGEKVAVDDILAAPLLVLLLGAAGVVLCLWKPDGPLGSSLSAACGAAGLWGYLACGVFRLGGSWGFHLLLCGLALAAGVAGIVIFVRQTMSQTARMG